MSGGIISSIERETAFYRFRLSDLALRQKGREGKKKGKEEERRGK
jgi:hypothetical protein